MIRCRLFSNRSPRCHLARATISMSTTTSQTSETPPSRSTPRPAATALVPLHVLGGGSIGLLFASALHRAHVHSFDGVRTRGDVGSDTEKEEGGPSPRSRPVTLLLRPHHRPRLRRGPKERDARWLAPVELRTTSNATHELDIPVEIIAKEGDAASDVRQGEKAPIQSLLLCTKANDAIPALESVWDRLTSSPSPSPPATVIVLSNGAFAIRDDIYKRWPELRTTLGEKLAVVLATTTHGAYRTPSPPSTGRYGVTHAGEGSIHSTSDAFVRFCRSAGWRRSATLSELDMSVMLWKKLAANCVINPLTALHDVENGRVLDVRHGGEDAEVAVKHILEEVSLVASVEMESLYEHVASGEGVVGSSDDLRSVREQLSAPALESFVSQVIADTAQNVSSMLQDVRAGRKTEVRYLNGYVARKGGEHGISCPRNEELCRLVEARLP